MELPDYADLESFAWLNICGVDAWLAFTPVFTSLTVVGATSYTGRWRAVGRKIEFQVQFSAATSVESTAGTTYVALPVTPAKGIAGSGTMQNLTTNVAVGLCVVDVTNSRLYIPSQVASGSVFAIGGWYEV